MNRGKAASQAGHAFLASFLTAHPKDTQAYLADGGTKVVLTAPSEESLRAIYERARKLGLPCALWLEEGHVMPPSFDGSPIITAVGIGPAAKHHIRKITKDLPLMK